MFFLFFVFWPDISTASHFLSLSFGSCLISGLCMTNTLLLPILVYLWFSSMLSLFSANKFRLWPGKVINWRWLGTDSSYLHGEASKVPIVECSSVLKQDHERKRDSTWSFPVRRRSWWRVPVATDKVQWKKSKIIDQSLSQAFFPWMTVLKNIWYIIFLDQKHQWVSALSYPVLAHLFLIKTKKGHKCITFSKRAEQIGNFANITQTGVNRLFVGLC